MTTPTTIRLTALLLTLAAPVRAQQPPRPVDPARSVTLSLAEYNRLIDLANRPPQGPAVPPVAAVLASATLRVTVDRDTARGVFDVNGDVLRAGVSRVSLLSGATLVDGTWRRSITNIGVRPTFENDAEPSIETYLFDFDGDLYGDVLRVRFLHRIRDERKFNGIDELKAQIEKDSRHALNYFKTQGVRNMLEIL